jgi:hypothetical protein
MNLRFQALKLNTQNYASQASRSPSAQTRGLHCHFVFNVFLRFDLRALCIGLEAFMINK